MYWKSLSVLTTRINGSKSDVKITGSRTRSNIRRKWIPIKFYARSAFIFDDQIVQHLNLEANSKSHPRFNHRFNTPNHATSAFTNPINNRVVQQWNGNLSRRFSKSTRRRCELFTRLTVDGSEVTLLYCDDSLSSLPGHLLFLFSRFEDVHVACVLGFSHVPETKDSCVNCDRAWTSDVVKTNAICVEFYSMFVRWSECWCLIWWYDKMKFMRSHHRG